MLTQTSNNPVKRSAPSGNDPCKPSDVQCIQQDLGITFGIGLCKVFSVNSRSRASSEEKTNYFEP
jgi:hypothetical protein